MSNKLFIKFAEGHLYLIYNQKFYMLQISITSDIKNNFDH